VLEELKEQYRKSLSEKSNSIRELVKALRQGDSKAADEIRRVAHTLHGSGSTFGFPEISEAARAVELADQATLIPALTGLAKVLIEAQARSPGQSLLGEKNILLVEDDQDISMLVATILKRKSIDYQIRIASSGTEARPLIATKKWDLIILDLMLPDVSGLTLLKEARQRQDKSTLLVVLSGVMDTAVRAECLEAGASAFFAKPFRPEEIAGAIDALLRTGQTNPPPPAQVAAKLPGKTVLNPGGPILLAEDDDLLAGVIKHRLSREKINVVHVRSGREALETLRKGGHSLAILDVKMPEMDGFEVLASVKREPGLAGLPVIMLTAMGNEKDVVRGYELGAEDYIVKPFSPAELLAKIKSVIKAIPG
jgi:DNA-binding response OmpR family regulator